MVLGWVFRRFATGCLGGIKTGHASLLVLNALDLGSLEMDGLLYFGLILLI